MTHLLNKAGTGSVCTSAKPDQCTDVAISVTCQSCKKIARGQMVVARARLRRSPRRRRGEVAPRWRIVTVGVHTIVTKDGAFAFYSRDRDMCLRVRDTMNKAERGNC